jgi:hypothetical protein
VLHVPGLEAEIDDVSLGVHIDLNPDWQSETAALITDPTGLIAHVSHALGWLMQTIRQCGWCTPAVVRTGRLDLFMPSWSCSIHGYNHPTPNNAIHEQPDTMPHLAFGGILSPTNLPTRQTVRGPDAAIIDGQRPNAPRMSVAPRGHTRLALPLNPESHTKLG